MDRPCTESCSSGWRPAFRRRRRSKQRPGTRPGCCGPTRVWDWLIVDGNPLVDISATERISLVVFKGERIRRAALFTETQNTTE